MDKKALRSSNFELLRILAMILIIIHHYSRHGGFSYDININPNLFLTQLLSVGGKVGVNLFVLISGYFLCEKKDFRLKSTVNFIFQVTTYALLICGAFLIFSPSVLIQNEPLEKLFPLIYNEYWFASAFLIFMITAPLLSRAIENTPKNLLGGIVLALFVLWCIIPTFTGETLQSNNLLWFYWLFLAVSFIKKYPCKITNSIIISFIVLFISVIYLILSFRYINNSIEDVKLIEKSSLHIIKGQSLPIVLMSFSIFAIFKNIKPFKSKIINSISSAMFGVYLIHDHSLVREHLWTDVFKNAQYQAIDDLYIHAIICISVVFLGCTATSMVYNLTFDRAFNLIYDEIKKKLKKGCYNK